MDAPKCAAKITSGKNCRRNAEADSEFCWQHGNSANTPKKSPKRSAKKKTAKSPGSPKVAWFDSLPMPALYQVLLRMPQKDLNSACKVNKRAAAICALPRFRDAYLATHDMIKRELFKGPLVTTYYGPDGAIYTDSMGNTLSIQSDNRRFKAIVYTPFNQIYAGSNTEENMDEEKLEISLRFDEKKKLRLYIQRTDPAIGWESTKPIDNIMEIKDFLKSIDKPKWYPTSKKRSPEGQASSATAGREFFKIVEKAISEANAIYASQKRQIMIRYDVLDYLAYVKTILPY